MLLSLGGVAGVTLATRVAAVNGTTVGFAYLLLVLVIASGWGFVEAAVASVAATLAFNFFFLPPVGTFTIADPQNWVALFSFLTTSLIASRLSAKAKRRALDAIERKQDVERLYTFSRALLLIGGGEPFPKQLVRKLAETFVLNAVCLYERRSGEFYRAGPGEFDGLDDQLRDAALQGTFFQDPQRDCFITAVRLGAEPIASLALQGTRMPDSVVQGIANLVAIGLERARAQDLAHQVEAVRQSEKLRATLIDAMAHEFKTPLTSIKAATTSLLANPDQPSESAMELLRVADEEAGHMTALIDNAVEMARLDSGNIVIHPEVSDVGELVREVVATMQTKVDERPIEVLCEETPAVGVDRRLMKLAVKQIVDNALKYSPPGTLVAIRVHNDEGMVAVDVSDHGAGIPVREQTRIFARFYRSPSVQHQVPGSGLGLSIAQGIVQAHHGELTFTSHPGETTFRIVLPVEQRGRRG